MHCVYWFFSTHLFFILCCLSAGSEITNVHIFLWPSYSFLLAASWCLPYSVDIFCHCGKAKIFIRIDRSVVYLWLGKTWDIWHHKPNFVIYMGTEVFTNPLNWDYLGKTRTNEICMLWEPQMWHFSLKCWYHHTRTSLHSLRVSHDLLGLLLADCLLNVTPDACFASNSLYLM